MGSSHTAVVGCVPIRVDGTAGRRHPVATTISSGIDRGGGIEASKTARTAEVFGVAIVVDGSISQKDPIAPAVRSPNGRGHRGTLHARRSEIGSIAKRVDVAVVRGDPIAMTGGIRNDRHRRSLASADTRTRPREVRIAEGEDAAVRADHEVAAAIGGRNHSHDRRAELRSGSDASGRSEPQPWEGAVEARITEGEDATVGSLQPIALPVRSGGDPDNRALQLQRAG